jgi:hypothetical protein
MLFSVLLGALVAVAVVSQVSCGLFGTRAERAGDAERAHMLRARGVTFFSWFAVAWIVAVVLLLAVILVVRPI